MGSGASVQFDIDNKLITSIVEQQVEAGIVAALGKEEDIVRRIVRLVLSEKVDREGKASRYSNDFTYLEWLCREAIKDATKSAVKKFIDERQFEIAEAIHAQIEHSTEDWAKAFMTGLANAMDSHWRFKVSIDIPKEV